MNGKFKEIAIAILIDLALLSATIWFLGPGHILLKAWIRHEFIDWAVAFIR